MADVASARRAASVETAWAPILVVAGITLLLLALANEYGFHRDELYFIVAGRHPALGYPGQPAFTPLVSVAAVRLFGLSPLAIRILPALCAGAIIVLSGLMARDLGGSSRAQRGRGAGRLAAAGGHG